MEHLLHFDMSVDMVYYQVAQVDILGNAIRLQAGLE